MRSMYKPSLALFAAMAAFGVFSASSALATLPVFSRGIAGQQGFPTTFTFKGGTTFLIPEETTFTCTENAGSGEITGEKTGVAKITLRGCKKLPFAYCTSTGASSGEVVSSTVPFKLVYTEKEPTVQVAIDLNSSRGTLFASFSCGSIAVAVRNSILVPVTPINTNTKSFTMSFKVSNNHTQEPRTNYKESLIGTESSFPEASWGGGGFNELFGLQTTDKLENLVKAKFPAEGKIEA